MTFALVVITGMSISSVVSSVMVMSVRNREKAARDAKEDARDAKKRARQEKAVAKEKASKEANEAARAEVVEAKRIEKESSEWATMLNNFMVAQLFKGDLTKYVNNGNVEVPGELAPHVLKKLKKRPSSKLRHCKETKDINQDLRFLTYNPRSHFNVFVEHEIPINGKMWDFFFTHKEEGKEGEALEITKCYDNKSKWLPDYFDSDNCQRNKHLEYMRNCGGPDLFTCPCSSDPGKNPEPDDNNVHFYKECFFRGQHFMVEPQSGRDWNSTLGGEIVQNIKSIIIPDGIVVKFYEEDEDGKKELIKEVKGPWSRDCTNSFVKVNLIVTENLK